MSKANPVYLKLATAPEELDEEKKPLVKNKFKLCFSVFKDKFALLSGAGIFLALSAIPLALIYLWALNAYLLELSAGFNYMGGIGIGYPGIVSSYAAGKIAYYGIIQKLFFFSVPAIWILAPAAAAYNHIGKKLLRGEKIADMKSVFKTGIIGVKKYWLNTLLTLVFFSIVFLALGSAVLYFLRDLADGTASSGSYVLLIFSALALTPLLGLIIHMLPLSVFYKLKFPDILKNAVILTIKNPLGVFIVGTASALPIALMFAIKSAVAIIAVLWLILGLMLTFLAWNATAMIGFDAFMNPLHAVRQTPQRPEAEKRKAVKNVYKNPKKKKK
ncbi:MAG: hypothetical protein ACOYIN_06350 [Christensenellales bacterium]|jgi:uncharacterized membrane protein YesL